MEYVKSNKGGFKLPHDSYMSSKRFFKNHQPTRGYTGNHCIISQLCTWETMKILKNETQKFYSGGFLSGGFCRGGVVQEPPIFLLYAVEYYKQTKSSRK